MRVRAGRTPQPPLPDPPRCTLPRVHHGPRRRADHHPGLPTLPRRTRPHHPLAVRRRHCRYYRYRPGITMRARDLVDQGTPIDAACSIAIPEDQLEEALRINEQLRAGLLSRQPPTADTCPAGHRSLSAPLALRGGAWGPNKGCEHAAASGCFEGGGGAAGGARERDPVPGEPLETVDDGVRRRRAAGVGPAAGVLLPITSKPLRHRALSTSVNIYAQLPPPPAQAPTASPGSSTTPPAKKSAPPPATPRSPTSPPRTGPCGAESTMRPPPDAATERASTRFPKYRLPQAASQTGRQDLNL